MHAPGIALIGRARKLAFLKEIVPCIDVVMESELQAPWWEQLPEDFWRQADGTELDASNRLKVHGTAAIERVLRTSLSSTVATAMSVALYKGGNAGHEFEALRFYEPLARGGDATRVFLQPPKGIAIETSPATGCSVGLRGIQRFQLRFASPFKPLNPAAQPQFENMQNNLLAHAQHWCHGDRPRPTLIVIHGFAADAPFLNAQALSLESLYRQGYDILLFTYPHHGPRAERGDLFSGVGLFGRGLLSFTESPLHAIHDLRVFIDYLQERGVEHIGVTGISLGGYTASLLATVDERLSFCIPIVPAVSPIDLFLEWWPTSVLLPRLMRSQGVNVAQMRGLTAVHNPLTYKPCIDGKRVLIIGGAGDRFSLPRHLRLLQRHWPDSQLHWFPGSHLIHLGRGEYLLRMCAFMDQWC
ncbi:hypothetical protein PMI26_00337 [Pseudomonas sp. GM33]|uniref:alpha/beta hydrolase family protein n=1 Tax=Pseudomonas sp. GM33 TaxID=1144329 RepID=UPI000270548D|nr:alpha/beta hydrolase family protein [Pseudomonas sp. GM33]EJM49266.1 hypothetical protein PMI26_00337 [Pseudomonas sp. GM33]